MKPQLIDVNLLKHVICENTGASIHAASDIVRVVLTMQRMNHRGECATDESARDVCEDIYADRTKDVMELSDALRAVYALAGESPEIAVIVNKAIEEHGL